ncbi:MAG: hypothetical protein ACLP07_03470 [Terracidiphilus sp.]
MNDGERDQAILRIVKRRKELRERKALIESELNAAGESLGDIGSSLRSISASHPQWLADILGRIQKAPDICELARIKAMVSELKEIYETFAQLNHSAAELGID